MAEFTLKNKTTGESITVEANSYDDAKALLATGDVNITRRAVNAKKLGLTPQDVASLFSRGREGHNAETSGKTNSALVGAGRTFDSWGTGAMQMLPEGARKAVSSVADKLPGVSETTREKLRNNSDDQLAKHEQAARDLFAQLDNQGIGMEDLGQALPEVLAFAGGGSVGLGWKALALAGGRGAALGAGAGALAGTVKEGERAANAKLGAVVGAAAPLLGVGVASLTKAVAGSAKAGVNWLGSIVGASKGNAQSALFAASRALSSTAAAKSAAAAARAAGDLTAQVPPGVNTSAVMAGRAMDSLGEIISTLRASEGNQVALNIAQQAFDKGFSTAGEVVSFSPAAAYNRLAQFTAKDLSKLGLVGQRLGLYKDFAKSLLTIDELDPAMVKQAVTALGNAGTEKETAQLVKMITKAANAETKALLVRALASNAGMAATGAPASAVQQFRQDTGTP